MIIAYHHGLRFWQILAGLPAFLVIDVLMGLGYRTNTDAAVTVSAARSGTNHRAIVVFPGYVMDGGTLGRAFAPYVGDNDALVVVTYAQRGVDASQIFAAVMESLRALRPAELSIYGGSMGGMVSKLFLDRYRQTGAPYGKVTLVLDTALANRSNVKRPSFLFEFSCLYRGGPLSSLFWAIGNRLAVKAPVGAETDKDIVNAARSYGQWVGMPAATSQACFIAKFGPLKTNELVDVAKQVIYLQGSSPDEDPLVRTSEAIAGWRVAFPKLEVRTVPGRNRRWHLPLVEYPRETVHAALAAHF